MHLSWARVVTLSPRFLSLKAATPPLLRAPSLDFPRAFSLLISEAGLSSAPAPCFLAGLPSTDTDSVATPAWDDLPGSLLPLTDPLKSGAPADELAAAAADLIASADDALTSIPDLPEISHVLPFVPPRDDLSTPMDDLPTPMDDLPAVYELPTRLDTSDRVESWLLLLLNVLFEPVTLVLPMLAALPTCSLVAGCDSVRCSGGLGLRLMLGLSIGEAKSTGAMSVPWASGLEGAGASVSEAASSSCNPSADILPSSGVTLRLGLGICSHHKWASGDCVVYPAPQLSIRLKPQTGSGKLMNGPTEARKDKHYRQEFFLPTRDDTKKKQDKQQRPKWLNRVVSSGGCGKATHALCGGVGGGIVEA
ncbi:MAG: hypothetical protein FRX49_11764 [Trebouxia sp. A1-2]|nr:MAG: hypothetical protein FRX49_11764 [Trebouxia sp. A1-2]